jgi:hypothetical protein
VKKNIKKAIKILDYLIDAHKRNSNGINNLIKDWNSDARGLGESIASTHEDVAKCLVIVKECIEEKPKCKHPKKMRDRSPDGKWYCMNCNEDVEVNSK